MKGEPEILVKGKMRHSGILYKPTPKQQEILLRPLSAFEDFASAQEEHEQGGNPNLQWLQAQL